MYFRHVAGDERLCSLVVGYHLNMTSMNRGIPIAIAVYRYCCVFHDSIIKDPRKNWTLQNLLFGIIAFNVGVSLTLFFNNPNSFRGYEVCMGREHAFEFNLNDFFVEKNVNALVNLPLSKRSRK